MIRVTRIPLNAKSVEGLKKDKCGHYIKEDGTTVHEIYVRDKWSNHMNVLEIYFYYL